MSRVKKKPHSRLAFLLLLALGVVGVFFWFSAKKVLSPTNQSYLPSQPPTPTPDPKIGTASQPSADGKVQLIKEVTATESGQLQYVLSVEKEGEDSATEIETGILDENKDIHIPFNTWSPDNKYFYIEFEQYFVKQYQVFTANGQGFNTEQVLIINQDFLDKNLPYNLTAVTGWASPTVLIVRTEERETGEPGPSYWYEVTTGNFIRLSSNF